jgi:hypothetical protein
MDFTRGSATEADVDEARNSGKFEAGRRRGQFGLSLASVGHKYRLPAGDLAEDRRRVARGPI